MQMGGMEKLQHLNLFICVIASTGRISLVAWAAPAHIANQLIH